MPDLHTALEAADSDDEPRRRDDAALRVEIGHTGDDGETCVRVYRDGKYRRALWVPADVLAVLTGAKPAVEREGCCRAAVDSDGQVHDHAGWRREARLADAEIERLQTILTGTQGIVDVMRPVYVAAKAWAAEVKDPLSREPWDAAPASHALLGAVERAVTDRDDLAERPKRVRANGPRQHDGRPTAYEDRLETLKRERDEVRAELATTSQTLTEANTTIVRAMEQLGVDHPVWLTLDDYDGSMDNVTALVRERDTALSAMADLKARLGTACEQRDTWRTMHHEVDAERNAMRPVVEAAKAYAAAWLAFDRHQGDDLAEVAKPFFAARTALVTAVDQLDQAAPAGHFYISTSCQHGLHEVCGKKQAERGEDGPPHCHHCPAVCACPVCRHGVDRG